MSGREIIGRWESSGGKYWVELYRDGSGYGYHCSNGGGFIGSRDAATEDQAVAYVENRTMGGAGFFHPGKTPMRRVVPANV